MCETYPHNSQAQRLGLHMAVNGAPPQPTFQPLRAALRPPRAVVVFDGGDQWLSNAALTMYSCGRIWGGSGFLLIPHHDGRVSRSLRRLAYAYDPDYVVTLPMTIGQFEAINPEVLRLAAEVPSDAAYWRVLTPPGTCRCRGCWFASTPLPRPTGVRSSAAL
jgi:hypothetical protein